MQAPSPGFPGSRGSPATHRRGSRAWLWIAVVWCALATAVALWQPPGPVSSAMPVTRAERGLWDWWRLPVERNAFRRLPDVSGVFTSIAVDAGGSHWWLAGEGGALVETRDGGATWEPLSTGTDRLLTALHASADGRRLWAVGERGTVLASDDGGQRWRTQTSGTDRQLRAVQFASDARTGWAVGDDGAAIATDDGGTTWRPMAGLGTSRLKDVRFEAAGRLGLVVGDGGLLFLTENGGGRWLSLEARPPALVPSSIAQSATGTSAPVQSSPVQSSPVPSIPVQSSPVQAAQAQPSLHTYPSDDWVAAALTADGQRIGLASQQGRFSWSSDRGKTWSSPTDLAVLMPESIAFSADGRHGAAVGAFGGLATSVDGGRTWRTQDSPEFRLLVASRVADDGQRAWALGKNGYLITSEDGGLAWAPAMRRALNTLTSVGFSDDGRRGWAVGLGGTVLKTEDGGKTWHRQSAGTGAGLGLLHVSADGGKAWAMDVDGKRVLQTTNGGASWEPGNMTTPDARAAMQRPRQSLQPPMPLPLGVRSGHIGADGLRGWAVGEGGLLLATRDGGRNWADPRAYARYPAPWYWLALLLAVPMFLRAWRLFTQAHQTVIGMADTPATDAALTDPRQDRLNFEPLAAGISRFLRNPATEPPLTLAITGDWGSGKSSLMGLICADLRKHGSRPIWFNAWHHQKEDHLFAALLGALSKQAPPPWLSLDGIGFRLRLLWLRSRKHWVFTLLLCTAVAALITLHLGMNDAVAETQLLRRLGDLLTSLGDLGSAKTAGASTTAATAATAANAVTAPPVPWAGWLALLTVAGTTLAALRKALTAFGADPAALLAGGLQGMKPKLAAEQNSFRTRFAEQFGEVSQALPERIVVVIDDLDRCRPEAVLEIMEAVNFLTSSGQCFVLFGMATDKVQAALAIAFERIAKELASGASGANDEKDPEAAARKQRRNYAANYLQKLINLEIKVPTEQSYEAWRLLTDDPATAESPSWRAQAMDGLRRHAMWLALAVAIAVGVSLGVLLRPDAPQTDERAIAPAPSASSSPAPSTAPAASAPSASGASSFPGQSASDPPLAWGVSPAQSPTRVLVQSGQESHADEWIAAAVLAVGAALAGLLLWRAASRRHREATDSKDFRDALKVWTELVRESAHTPRAVKRFGNKLRYFEMLQQGEERDRTLLDDLKARLRRMTAKRDGPMPVETATPRTEPNRRIAAPQLVALGALHEVFGTQWLVQQLALSRSGAESDLPPGGAQLLGNRLIKTHTALFSTDWPPSFEEMQTFARLLDGIRMPGESEELDMRRSGTAVPSPNAPSSPGTDSPSRFASSAPPRDPA